MDHQKFHAAVHHLYAIVDELEDMFPGRPFTPDGHMVGSLGECLVADAYDLSLMPPSNRGYDAVSKEGIKIEIKATQAKSVAFRVCPEHTIIIRIARDGTFEECFNGPGELIWKQFEGRPRPSNGQFQISVRRVKELNESVSPSQRVQRVA